MLDAPRDAPALAQPVVATGGVTAVGRGGGPGEQWGVPVGVLAVCCADALAAEELCIEVRRQHAARVATLLHRGRPWWLQVQRDRQLSSRASGHYSVCEEGGMGGPAGEESTWSWI